MRLNYLTRETLNAVIALTEVAHGEKDRDRGPLGVGLTEMDLKLREYINSLSDDEKAELLAVMWIGRRDGGATVDDFEGAFTHAKSELDHVGEYMTNKDPLAQYLKDGMQLLGL